MPAETAGTEAGSAVWMWFGDEDGGWAELAGCPYGVQGSNRGGRVGEEASSLRLAQSCQLGEQFNLCLLSSA